MTTDKLLEVLRFYRRWIDETHNILPVKNGEFASSYRHVAWMCQHAELELVPRGRIKKAMRRLGFVQGVLAAWGDFTLAELKSHSRTEEETPP